MYFISLQAPSVRFGAETINGKSIEMKVLVTSVGYENIDKSMIVYLNGKSDYIFVQTKRPIYRFECKIVFSHISI